MFIVVINYFFSLLPLQVLDMYNMNSSSDGPYGMAFHFWILALLTATFWLIALGVFRIKSYQLSH